MKLISLKEYLTTFDLNTLVHESISGLIINRPKVLQNKYKAIHYLFAKLLKARKSEVSPRLPRLVVYYEIVKLWMGYSNSIDLRANYLTTLESFLELIKVEKLTPEEKIELNDLDFSIYYNDEEVEEAFLLLGDTPMFQYLKSEIEGFCRD